MSIASQPETQGFPMPRATTAACEVLPPRLVRMPCAAKKPWMSSGLVSSRTRITLSPSLPRRSAVSASNTIAPEAAPGDAGSPCASDRDRCAGSSVGTSSCSRSIGLMRASARSFAINPSATISTELVTIARAFILPLRVCRQ
jgi:hypothetical protein